jgi:hypothetical protein
MHRLTEAEALLGRQLTMAEIIQIGQQMLKHYGFAGLPFNRYVGGWQ